jgi:raffinose/stachyose/melibiose transport system permease protein
VPAPHSQRREWILLRESSLVKRCATFLAFNGLSLFAFLSVLIIPFAYGLILTFTDWNAISDTFQFIGLTNYATVFADKEFVRQFLITIRYVVISAVLVNVFAFTIAYFLTSGMRGQNFLRGGFFVPNLIGGIILGYIWKFIFANVLTQLGKGFDIPWLKTSFLTNPDRAIWAMIIVTVWQYAGYLMMIYIAGFVGIPRDVQEAADIDGAHGLRKLRSVTIPLMLPSFNICIFITMSRCFMAYDLNLALTNGGPYGSTQLAAMHVYQKAFMSKQFGVGQAEAIVLFVVVALISVTQVLLNKKREVEV